MDQLINQSINQSINQELVKSVVSEKYSAILQEAFSIREQRVEEVIKEEDARRAEQARKEEDAAKAKSSAESDKMENIPEEDEPAETDNNENTGETDTKSLNVPRVRFNFNDSDSGIASNESENLGEDSPEQGNRDGDKQSGGDSARGEGTGSSFLSVEEQEHDPRL